MKQPALRALPVFTLLLLPGFAAYSQSKQDTKMNSLVSGPFEVKLAPQKPDSSPAEESKLGRMSIDKEFHGDLEAVSKGEMLSFMSEVKGSGGYVAMERVTGTLKGKHGSFVLQHTGSMKRGEPSLTITVVPDTGTEELAGLTGTMAIRIEAGGKHFYDFTYALP